MESSEMEDTIRQAGWIPIKRKRRNGNVYIYASYRDGARMRERYIAPLSKIGEMSTEQIISKLQK